MMKNKKQINTISALDSPFVIKGALTGIVDKIIESAYPTSKQLGGKREGSGRRQSTNPARHIVKIRLTDAQYAKWKELGASRWAKRLLEETKPNT